LFSGIEVSQRTVQRRLAEEGLIGRRPARKPRLTPAMISKRYQRARKYKDFTTDNWKNVCFSDESIFQVLVDKSQFVRRRTNEKYKPECIVPTIKHPPSVMVWSVISYKGQGALYVVDGTMSAEKYQEVLETQLLPQVKKWFNKREKPIFMHDGVDILDWPGNSPDMNPIENVWEFLKSEVTMKAPTTKQELINILNDTWKYNPELKIKIQNCISSMPRRVEAVLAAKGGHTKY
ncbi:unnamed protein product, partial [Acanthoscelides obtectus]